MGYTLCIDMGPLLITWINLIPINHISSKVWDEITNQFPNLYACAYGVGMDK